MLSWVLGKKNKRKTKKRTKDDGSRPSYEEAKVIAQKGSLDERRQLASHEDLEPELLYYFANDKAPEVRREVADNDGTPLQADIILAKDEDEDVRCELARKIGRLIPNLSDDQTDKLTTLAIEVLEVLAKDNLPLVRSLVAEELKHSANIPHRIIRRLAEDVEEIVAAPILEYSPMLSDRDLLEIIAGGLKGGALVALSQRGSLNSDVADAIADTMDEEAVATLLVNERAQIREETLDKIVEEAPNKPGWHEPIVKRESLSTRIMKRIASFVSASLVDMLIERNNLREDLVEEIRKTVRKRIDSGELSENVVPHESAKERAEKAFEAGELTEGHIRKALSKKDNSYVRYALVHLSDLPLKGVSKMLNTGNAKAVTTLCWICNLSMDLSVLLQETIAKVKPENLLKPTEDGGYPMEEEDMEWYVEFHSE